jgi:hypothetical protein
MRLYASFSRSYFCSPRLCPRLRRRVPPMRTTCMCSLSYRKAESLSGCGDHGGLYFKLEPGWHVYWKNPGDAGAAAHTLDASRRSHGWTVAVSAPKRLPLGPLMDYGYEDEVLFPFKLELAKSVKTYSSFFMPKSIGWSAEQVAFRARRSWRLHRRLSRQPAATEKDDGPGVEIWKRLARLLPDALPPADRAFFQPTKEGFRLTVETGKRETQADVLPGRAGHSRQPCAAEVHATANGLTLDLKKDANLAANPLKS